MHSDILTIEEVAAYLRVSERTVYDWAQKGEIPCGRLGSSWRFRKSDILEWIDANIPAYKKRFDTMTLSQVLAPERCLVLSETNKSNALQQLLDSYRKSYPPPAFKKLKQGIESRESIMSTGLSNGLAVPHLRTADVQHISVAFAHVRPPLTDYESLDNSPVEYVAMILAGRNQHEGHLRVLAEICRRLKDDATRKCIQTATTGAEVFTTLVA
jgi:nitrogen PTS system EIIA component